MKMTLLRKMVTAAVLLGLSCVAFADPPEQSGANVVRWEGGGAWTFTDWDAGILVVFGANMDEFCSGTINFDVVSFMEVTIPQGPDRIKQLVKGKDVQATVWPFPFFDCYLFTTVEPIAYGTVDLIYNDNDLISWARNNKNMNAFGMNAHGNMLSTASGDALRLNFVWHAIFRDYNDEDPGNDFFKEILKIDLH